MLTHAPTIFDTVQPHLRTALVPILCHIQAVAVNSMALHVLLDGRDVLPPSAVGMAPMVMKVVACNRGILRQKSEHLYPTHESILLGTQGSISALYNRPLRRILRPRRLA